MKLALIELFLRVCFVLPSHAFASQIKKKTLKHRANVKGIAEKWMCLT